MLTRENYELMRKYGTIKVPTDDEISRLESEITNSKVTVSNDIVYVYTPMRPLAWLFLVPALRTKYRAVKKIKYFSSIYCFENRKITVRHTFFKPKPGKNTDFLNPVFGDTMATMEWWNKRSVK